MFPFWFCPKLQDKHCKSTMIVTMTGKTRYMPPPLLNKGLINKQFSKLNCHCFNEGRYIVSISPVTKKTETFLKELSKNVLRNVVVKDSVMKL